MAYNNLLLNVADLSRVRALRSYRNKIGEDGIDNTISIDKVTRVTSATRATQEQQTRRASPANVNQNAKPMALRQSKRLLSQTVDQQFSTLGDRDPTKPTDNQKPDGTDPECTVDRIVRYVG